jgi:hypothetical protein
MLTSVVVLVFVLFALVFFKFKTKRFNDSLVYAAISVGLVILVSTELLSAIGNLSAVILLLGWLALGSLLLLCLSIKRDTSPTASYLTMKL